MPERDSKGRFVKGTKTWNKGLTSRDDYRILAGRLHPSYAKPNANRGKVLSQETRQKMSIAMMGNKNPKGRKKSLAFRQKVSENNRKRIGPLNPNFGKKRSMDTKLKMRAKRALLKIPRKDTIPERFMQSALAIRGINFVTQKTFKVKDTYHRVDIFIEPNICVEVDGHYWHKVRPGAKERDMIIDEELERQVMIVIRISDNDILLNPKLCVDSILGVIS